MPPIDQLASRIDRLAEFDPGPYPVVSLYLDLRPDAHGRDHIEPFLRKELTDRLRTYPVHGPERRSIDGDAAAIRAWVERVDPAANGAAVFACAGADLFDAIELAAPVVDRHRLSIADRPHLYPLAHLVDAYPRYAAVVADTQTARIFVFAVNRVERQSAVEGTRTHRHKAGGWSQARFQRHVDNYHLQHAKEVVDRLARIVRAEQIQSVVVAGDEVIVPLLKQQFPKELADKVVDVLRLDIRTPEREILDATLATMRARDAVTDRQAVDALLDAYRANGLAVVGPEPTRRALEKAQVDELLLTGSPDAIAPARPAGERDRTANDLVVQARQTGARVRFIEDESLLAAVGGAGALLRFAL